MVKRGWKEMKAGGRCEKVVKRDENRWKVCENVVQRERVCKRVQKWVQRCVKKV